MKIHFFCYIIFVDTKAIILTIRDDNMIFGRAQDPPLRLRGRIANGGAANSAAVGGGLPMAVWQTVQLKGGVPRGRREESRLYKCAPKNKRSIVVDFERSDNFNDFVNYFKKVASSTTLTKGTSSTSPYGTKRLHTLAFRVWRVILACNAYYFIFSDSITFSTVSLSAVFTLEVLTLMIPFSPSPIFRMAEKESPESCFQRKVA